VHRSNDRQLAAARNELIVALGMKHVESGKILLRNLKWKYQ
jgi:hypothetical protein